MKFKRVAAIVLRRVLPPMLGVAVLAVSILVAGKFVKVEWRETIQPEEKPPAPRQISQEDLQNIGLVREVTKDYTKEAVGTLKAANRTEISSRILAQINQIMVRAGDTVQAGQVLIVLDSQALKTKLSQARAALAAANASVVHAKDQYDRGVRLRAKDLRAITATHFNELVTNLNVNRAKQAVAQQEVAGVEVLLSYTTIRAPKAGMIVDRKAEPGDMAQPGVPLLVLYDPTSLRLEVPVTEDLAVKLKVGENVAVHIDALNRDVQGVVDEIVPQAEAASRSFLVKVKLPRSKGLFEGMAGRLKIPAGTRRHLCLATAAIHTVGQLDFVCVVDPENRTATRRYIRTGRLGMPGHIEVLSGLKAGDRVLLKPVPEVIPKPNSSPSRSARPENNE